MTLTEMMKSTFFVLIAVVLSAGLIQGCRYLESECDDGSGCIPNYWFCDGLTDCKDGSDEKNCGRTCPENKFDCNGDGLECIGKRQVCNGKENCINGNDEKNCGVTTPEPQGTVAPVAGCGSRSFEQDLSGFQQRKTKEGEIPFVVGGIKAVRGSLPWQVSVQMSYGSFHFCGGTIIDKQWILTAAHCFEDGASGTVIVAGEHNLAKKQGSEQKIKIVKSFVHPKFNGRTYENDIALLKLQEEIQFDDYSQPACLPSKSNEGSDYAEGGWLTISGWGSTQQTRDEPNTLQVATPQTRDEPNTLQVATVPLIAQNKCKEAYPGKLTVQSDMFCAGKLGVGGTDTCQGDSGGPVVKKVNGKFTVLGVVSWGIGCARPDKPGVYTRVARYESWLQNTLQKN